MNWIRQVWFLRRPSRFSAINQKISTSSRSTSTEPPDLIRSRARRSGRWAAALSDFLVQKSSSHCRRTVVAGVQASLFAMIAQRAVGGLLDIGAPV
jgi:hypothetical protein